jgi:hypothetical protein
MNVKHSDLKPRSFVRIETMTLSWARVSEPSASQVQAHGPVTDKVTRHSLKPSEVTAVLEGQTFFVFAPTGPLNTADDLTCAMITLISTNVCVSTYFPSAGSHGSLAALIFRHVEDLYRATTFIESF